MNLAGKTVGMTGYVTLRTDLFAPADNSHRFFPLVKAFYEATGNYVHWFPLRGLKPDCTTPKLGDPEEDEAHRLVVNYGDSLRSMIRYLDEAPSRGRQPYINARPYHWNDYSYGLPELDVLVVFTSGMPAAAWYVDGICKRLHELNPKLGIVAMDQDRSLSTFVSKGQHWGVTKERVAVMTEHSATLKRYPVQYTAYCPHLPSRCREISENDGCEVAYVGNDYDRRPAMDRFFTEPETHWYGKLRNHTGKAKGVEGFREEVPNFNATWHGPFSPKAGEQIEDIYAQHGFGLNISRDVYYETNNVTPRFSEINRAGVPFFADEKFSFAKVLAGEHFTVPHGPEMVRRARAFASSPGFKSDTARWQRAQLERYVGVDRWCEAFLRAAANSLEGPKPGKVNLYADLMEACGQPTWK